MAMLVFQYRAISLEYFLDRMQAYELAPILDNLSLCIAEGWEQTRHLMRAMLMPYHKGELSLKNVLALPWDKEEAIKKASVTKQTIEAARRLEAENREMLQRQGII